MRLFSFGLQCLITRSEGQTVSDNRLWFRTLVPSAVDRRRYLVALERDTALLYQRIPQPSTFQHLL